jgi:hypothetical protein
MIAKSAYLKLPANGDIGSEIDGGAPVAAVRSFVEADLAMNFGHQLIDRCLLAGP